MGYKKKTEGQFIKSYKLKVRSCSDLEKFNNAISEFTDYYNRTSKWVCENLDTPLCEIAKHIDQKRRGSKYYRAAMDENWRNEPLYKIFTKAFTKKENFSKQGQDEELANDSNCDNILIYSIMGSKSDEYTGNVLGFSESSYRLAGYIKSVISNYKTKIRTSKPNVRKTTVTELSSDDEKLNNTIYEIGRNGFSRPSEMADFIKYLTSKDEVNEKLLERFTVLYNYYKDNEETIKETCQTISAKTLKANGGCIRKKDRMSMAFLTMDYKIKRKEGCQGYILTLSNRNKTYEFDLYGRRDLILDNNELVDVSKHGESIIFKHEDGNFYVVFTVDTTIEKDESNMENVVGIDVNTKHVLLVSSVDDDGTLKGYTNIYKYFVEDEELMSLIPSSEKEDLVKLSKTVSFGPIEENYLFSNILSLNEKSKQIEKRINSLLGQVFDKETDPKTKTYVGCVRKMRNLLKHYLYLKNTYYLKQKEYDIAMGFKDVSTASKETMDKRRFENPFGETEEGKEMNIKMFGISRKIVANRDNVLNYAYKVFEENGYDGFVLEDLTSSTFGNYKPSFPSAKSILDYHHLRDMPFEAAKENDVYQKFSDKYDFILDENNVIKDASLSENGLTDVKKGRAKDTVIKAVHFAEVKNVMTMLSNKGKIPVVWAPSYYSSQMDSVTHKVYTTYNKKGKEVIAPKNLVRPRQEMHINGINCDVNAAKNLKYIYENEEWRDLFLKKTTNGYNEPAYKSAIKNQAHMLRELKKAGATCLIAEKPAKISKQKRSKSIETK